MNHLRHRKTGEEQEVAGGTLWWSESQLDLARHVVVPRVLSPLDEIQAGRTSQSRRVTRSGSASHWSRGEVALAGPAMPTDEPQRTYQLMRAWDGLVTEVTEQSLVARIVPLDGLGAEEEAEFLISDVPEEDRPLVRRGALLYWFVGYETDRGRRRRTSELKMRRVKVAADPSEAWLAEMESLIVPASDSLPTEG